MTEIIEVPTKVGKWVLKKPNAGVRNRAMAAAETDSGGFRNTIFMMELIPKCIQSRPDGFDTDVPINQVVDGLDTKVYDELVVALAKLIGENPEEFEEKKTSSMTSSTQEESQKKDQNVSG